MEAWFPLHITMLAYLNIPFPSESLQLHNTESSQKREVCVNPFFIFFSPMEVHTWIESGLTNKVYNFWGVERTQKKCTE